MRRLASLLIPASACLLVAGIVSAGAMRVGPGGLHLPSNESAAQLPVSSGCPALPATPTFDFDASQEAYANNDPVTSMTDQGSNGVDLTQGTGSAQPTFKDPCDGTVSKACYDFDGGDHTESIAATFGTFTQANLICVVWHFDSAAASSFVYDGAGSSTRNSLHYAAGTGDYNYFAGSSVLTSIAPVNDQWERDCFEYNGASSAGDLSGASTSGSAGAHSLGGLVAGASTSRTSKMNGAIARIVGFDTNSGRADVQAHLDCEYGL